MAPYFVYIIRYIDDASGNVCYYTGTWKYEYEPTPGTRFITWSMKYISTHSTRAGAMLEERRVKRLSHDRKEMLFQGVV